jgi:long-chain acyl-CoA synthetase
VTEGAAAGTAHARPDTPPVPASAAVPADDLPLQRAYRWERERAHEIFLSQPYKGRVRDWTWAQALAESRSVAAMLAAAGWPPGSSVALMAKNSAWWIMADLAIWMAGHVSVPIYPSLAGATVRQILEHSQARACFVGRLEDPDAARSGIPDGLPCIAMPGAPPAAWAQWDEIVATHAPIAGAPLRAATDVATIVYTSGTTGVPKGAMHSFAAIGWAPTPLLATLPLDARERMLSYLPLAHVTERWLVEANALRLGCRIFFVESVQTFLDDLKRARPTLFFSVPRLWTKFRLGVYAKTPPARLDRLLRIPLVGRYVRRRVLAELGLDSVRFAGSGSAPLPSDVLAWYRDLGLELNEGYGMTENFGVSHGSQPGRGRLGYVGHPWAGVQCRLSDSGEVLVRGPTLMLGYYRDAAQTRAAFTEDGYLRTGDVGALDEDGRLRITGRAKEQFKTSKGKYVAPGPIENRLGGHPAIETSCVTGASHAQPFAIVTLAPGDRDRLVDAAPRSELTTSLVAHLHRVNASLDPHERLAFLAVVTDSWTTANGLLTPTLKVRRAAVEERYGPSFDRWADARTPVVYAD